MLAWLLGLLPGVCDAAEVRTGDLVFHRSRTEQSALLARVTGSPWTHVGVVFVRDGVPVVLEAGDPVGFVPLAAWARRAADGRIGIRRLRSAERGLPDDAVARLEDAASRWVGRRYDAAFAWSDDRMYCSELAYKVLTEATGAPVGDLRAFGSFDLSDPAVKRAVAARWGQAPLDEPVIAPSDLYADPRWASVCEGTVDACL